MRLALLSLLAVACWKDLPTDGSLRCAPGAQPCPGGYHCAADTRCWRDGHQPDLLAAPDDFGLDDLSHTGDAMSGQSCGADTECVTAFCTDGVCCDKRCQGQCQSCNLPGSSGICKTTPQGPPPPGRAACSGSGTPCGGYCDGLGGVACVHPIGNVACGASCNGICDGKGNCSTAGSCAGGYACGSGSCLTSCASNADCQSGSLCQGSKCILTIEVDCLDGVDNNGDGLADCQDPSCGSAVTCVDDPGSELGVDISIGLCPSAYPSPLPLFQGLMFPPPCQGCACTSSLTCTYTPQFSPIPSCALASGGPSVSVTVTSTSGSASGCAAIPTPPPSPNPGSVNPGVPTASVRGCSSGGTSTTPSPTWQVSSKWCGGARRSMTCPSGKVCVPRPATGQALCTRLPNGSACPAGYQLTQETWFAGFTDNRTCTTCGCVDSGAGVSCGDGTADSLLLWSDPACSGAAPATVSGGNSCQAISSVTNFEVNKSNSGMVFPVCSPPTGSGTAAPADPSLLCCSSCACATAPCLGGCPGGNFCDGSACTSCNTLAFCGASCASCAPLGDSCTAGTCKCGSTAACNSTTADNCTGGLCRCGTSPPCVGGIFGCLGGTCI